MNQYILYCAQEANFQTRSMLVPVLFLDTETREKFNGLKTYGKKILYRKTNKYIGHLILQETCDDIYEDPDELYKYKLCNYFTQFANQSPAHDLDETSENDQNDQNCAKNYKWFNYVSDNLCKGYDHVKNYLTLLETTRIDDECKDNIEIVDSFLVLETYNGEYTGLNTIDLSQFDLV